MFRNTKIRKIWAYTLFQTLPTSLKRPHIVVTWKESVRKSLGDIKVEVDNPARKKLKETEEKPAGGGGGQPHP